MRGVHEPSDRDGEGTPERSQADGPARIASSSASLSVMTLQRQAGNRATAGLVGRFLARRVVDRPSSHPVLRRSRPTQDTAEIELLQSRLNEDGADPPVQVTGVFDQATDVAVRAFQTRHGLRVDGIVGIRTWGMLDELERQGIAGPVTTVLDEVAPVSQAQHDVVEQILHPGHTGGSPAASDPMTGTGRGGAYETEMLDALDRLADETIARPVATPAVDMAHANRVSELAQREVESFFGATITVASRRPNGDWHPGSSRMGLADATTRPVTEGDILGWSDYFMDNGTYEPAQIAASHDYDNTRARPDRAEHDRVRGLWLNTRGGRQKVRQMIRSWPAEAGTGTVFLQLRDPAYQSREGMWSLFGTMIHEFMHLVTHPNYSNTADAIGGGARDILIEGMDEHMTQQVWRDIRPRIAGDTALRQTVEGPFFAADADTADYDEDSAIDHVILDNHYDSMADADAIAAQVGEGNVRAAFFMGHVEAIGIGQGSSSVHSLRGLASWRPDAGGRPDEYVVPPAGQTLQQIIDRTGSTDIADTSGTAMVDPTQTIAGGTVLRVPGLRWHTTIAEDTLGQIATQHGITQEQLERANGFRPRTGTTRLPPGTVVMIPVHP